MTRSPGLLLAGNGASRLAALAATAAFALARPGTLLSGRKGFRVLGSQFRDTLSERRAEAGEGLDDAAANPVLMPVLSGRARRLAMRMRTAQDAETD